MSIAGVEIRFDTLAVFALKLLDKMLGKQEYVGLALAQRRHEDREDVQTIVKILAKLRALNRFFQILVRRNDQPYVYFDCFNAAEPFKLALLQNAQ
jgi:hypothetical protein